jgi:hypothetical protein
MDDKTASPQNKMKNKNINSHMKKFGTTMRQNKLISDIKLESEMPHASPKKSMKKTFNQIMT